MHIRCIHIHHIIYYTIQDIIYIPSISNSSIFHKTELCPGMIIMMINGSKYKDFSVGLEKLQTFPQNYCMKQILAGPVGTTPLSHGDVGMVGYSGCGDVGCGCE